MAERARRRAPRKSPQALKRERRKKAVRPRVTPRLPFERINFVLLWTGIILAALSFVLLALDYPVVSVVFSVLGYMIFIPVALIYARRRPPQIEKPEPEKAAGKD